MVRETLPGFPAHTLPSRFLTFPGLSTAWDGSGFPGAVCFYCGCRPFCRDSGRILPDFSGDSDCQKNLQNFMKNRENPLDIEGIFFYYIEAVRKGETLLTVLR